MRPPKSLLAVLSFAIALLLSACNPRLTQDELEERLQAYDWQVTDLHADTLLLADSLAFDGQSYDYTHRFEGCRLVFGDDGRYQAICDSTTSLGIWQSGEGRKPPRTFFTLDAAKPEWEDLLNRKWTLNINFEKELHFQGEFESYDVRLTLKAY